MNITLVKAVQTCAACPSQWDAWDANGHYYYLRYRHGHGEVVQPPSKSWYESNNYSLASYAKDMIITFEYGDSLDGYITLEEFAREAGIKLSPDIDYNPYEDETELYMWWEP